MEIDSSPADVSVDISHSLWSGILPGLVLIVLMIAISRDTEVNENKQA